MKIIRRILLVCATAAMAQAALAGTNSWFEPLTQSASVVPPNDLQELYSPWVLPEGISQKNLVSMREVEDSILSPLQSIVRAQNLGSGASMFDMIAYDDSGNYLFIPHETAWGAGCSRYHIYHNFNEVIFAGDGQGESSNWDNDFAAFDPARWTPNGTVFLGEEWSGLGRIVEILNPMAPAEEVEYRILESIANVAHEGIEFSQKYPDTFYFIDEWNSGSIYKFVMKKKNDYTVGQTFVLSVDRFAQTGGVAEDNWNEQADGVVRDGPATWIPITDADGIPLPGITDPYRDGPTNDPRNSADTRGGRPAADDVGGTPYGRPEDMAIGTLRNGHEVLYIAVTSENSIISIEILDGPKPRLRRGGEAVVRTFATGSTPKNVGFAPTTGALNSPDNLAIDALGNIYIIEDAPNSSLTGGDIWFARDRNNDGVAESLDHFMSIQVNGSEATGMIFNPVRPTEYVVAVQHPDSTDLDDVPDGLGDTVWMFDLSNIPKQSFVRRLNDAVENR